MARKRPTIHLLGNAHLDPVWLWRWPEGVDAMRSTCRSALDRMNETPDFRFSRGSAALYQWLEWVDPETFGEIKRRVREGKWEIVTGWWVQSDCNLPCGEAFVRQALYGKKYFRRKFGVDVRVGYNVDSFGHHAMLPQILKKCGLDYYIASRPAPHEESRPVPKPLFWWRSPDGSRVLAYFNPFGYGFRDESDVERRVLQIAEKIPPGVDVGLLPYGVGNHGGGPTRKLIKAFQRAARRKDLPEIAFSTALRFFKAAEKRGEKIPVYQGEHQHHARGCYTTVSAIKALVRRGELALVSAEKFAAIAAQWCGSRYPAARLEKTWQRLLFNEFHDILPGSSTAEVCEDAVRGLRTVRLEADETSEFALSAISAHVDTTSVVNPRHVKETAAFKSTKATHLELGDGGTSWLLFNPCSWEVKTPVAVDVDFSGPAPAVAVFDPSGRRIPSAVVDRCVNRLGMWPRYRTVFTAKVPPLGYALYRLLPAGRPLERKSSLKVGSSKMENKFLRVRFDTKTGGVASLVDKRTRAEMLSAPACVALVMDDRDDAWAHASKSFRDLLGRFKPVSRRVALRTPLVGSVRVDYKWRSSRMRQEFTLFEDSDWVEVRVLIDWREKRQAVKLAFPVNVEAESATFEIPYGAIERPATGEEEPGLAWVDVSGRHVRTRAKLGLAVVNDAKYGYDVYGGEIRVTVLRSVPFSIHSPPASFRPSRKYLWTDQGEQEFTYWLLPHAGDWRRGKLPRRAAQLLNPPRPFFVTEHGGALPNRLEFLSAEPANVDVEAVKIAEDGGGMVLRLRETVGRATEAAVKLGGSRGRWKGRLGPWEIKTLKVERKRNRARFVETDMIERPVQ